MGLAQATENESLGLTAHTGVMWWLVNFENSFNDYIAWNYDYTWHHS